MTILHSARLRLEPFAPAHLDGLHALDADPAVMRFITGRPETREETVAIIARVQARWAAGQVSWWSFLDRGTGQVVGAGCIQHLRRDATVPDPSCPLEIGWRLRRDRWGQGLASEAARTMAGFAFDTLQPPELLAVCQPANVASIAVMRRLGMQARGLGHWYGMELATYGVTAAQWEQASAARHP